MTLLYFAWLRSRIGTARETVALPAHVTTVGELIEWLKTRGPGYAEAMKDRSVVRVAVNEEYVGFDHPVRDADEVAIFPPVTGG